MTQYEQWQQFLSTDNTSKELPVPIENYLHDLSDLGIIAVSGEDASTFLQGQLSGDMNDLTNDQYIFSSLNTLKGRCVATLTIIKIEGIIHLILSKDLISSVMSTLNKYIVFSQASLHDKSDELILFGLSGNMPSSLTLKNSTALTPKNNMSQTGTQTTLYIPGHKPRYLFIAPYTQAKDTWLRISEEASLGSPKLWELADIEAGSVRVNAVISEQFLPHNLNLHLTGAVNFEKGCYTGQEIIARMQYRGKLKNQVYLCQIHAQASSETDSELLAGSSISSIQNDTAKSIGEIINIVMQTPGNYRALVSLPVDIQTKTLPTQLQVKDKEISLNELKVPGYAINKRQ